MTSLTTAGGLLSFVSAGIAPVAELGIFAAVGVMLALCFSLVALPAMLAVFPLKSKHQSSSKLNYSHRLDSCLTATGDFATRHPWPVVIVSGLLLTGSLLLASTLSFSHNSLIYLSENVPVRKAIELIDHKMKGSLNVEIIVDTE